GLDTCDFQRRRRSIARTTTAIATTAAAPASVGAPSPGAGLAGLRLIHGDVSAVMIPTVETFDGCLGFGVLAHLDEGEALRAIGVAINDQLCALHRPVRCEKRFEVCLGDVV